MVSYKENLHNYFIVALLFMIGLKTSLSFLLMFMIVVAWIWHENIKEKIHFILKDPLSRTFLLLFAIHLLGLFWTQSYEEGLKILSKQKTYLIAPIILSFFDKRFVKYALWAFLASVFISELRSLYLYFTHLDFKGFNPVPFMHHMHYSLILAFTFGYLLSEVDLRNFRARKNILFLLFATLTLVVLFINIGRIGQLALPLVLFILAIGKLHFSWVKSLLFTALGAVILFTAAYQLSDNFQERVNHANYELTHVLGTQKRDSIVCRFEMWDYATQLGNHNPIIGIGTGDSIRDMRRLLGKDGFEKLFFECGLGLKYQFNPHNNFILFYMQFGLLGIVVLLAALFLQLRIALKLKSLPMLILLGVTIIGMMTTSLISMHIKYTFFYAFVLSMLYLDAQIKNAYQKGTS